MSYHRCKWGSLTLFVYLYTRSVALVATVKEHDYVMVMFFPFFCFVYNAYKEMTEKYLHVTIEQIVQREIEVNRNGWTRK